MLRTRTLYSRPCLDVANAKGELFTRAARTVLSVARPCTISGDILSTPLSYPQSPKLNDPYLMIKLRKSLLLNARRRLCVLCTLLFMMSIEALVKREKEKKSLVLEFIHISFFLVHETQHTHDKTTKFVRAHIKSNRLISASHLAKIKRVIKVWVRIRND